MSSSSSSAAAPKKGKMTRGRQKIPIKKVENENKKQVTFSKRKAGLVNKAAELCILCGARVGFIIFSETGRSYSFGYPDIDTVVDDYLAGRTLSGSMPPELARLIEEHNKHYEEAVKEMEVEKRKAEEIRGRRGGGGCWWEEPVEGMESEELDEFVKALEELSKNARKRLDELVAEQKPVVVANSFDGGFNGGFEGSSSAAGCSQDYGHATF